MKELLFDQGDILSGQKFSEHLLKFAQREHPRVALIALGLVIVMCAQQCRIKKAQLFNLLETLDNALNNPMLGAAQEAASRLIVPSGR